MASSALPISIIERIDALLPQTQCRRCGFDACRPYAEALANGTTEPNRCPPGGQTTVDQLSALLGTETRPLDETRGAPRQFPRARIVESSCIGCTLCIQACPVDAIVGAAKVMHTVLGDDCTGCGLCVPPCPVDCIVLEPDSRAWTVQDADRARERFARRARRSRQRSQERRVSPGDARRDVPADAAVEVRRAAVAAALARARTRRGIT